MSERPELAAFLRARREALRPSDVGLPDSGRRRTPGLRREEVATLAGVSIDYLIRLEQGRDLHPSSSVLAALAKALRLNDEEKIHLKKLTIVGPDTELCPSQNPLARSQVATGVRQLLDSLNETPAFVVGPASHVLAWNTAWERIVAPLGVLDDSTPNLARYIFTHAKARTAFKDWDEMADEQVSWLRSAEPLWARDEAFAAVLDELRPLPEFAVRWSAHPVADKHRGVTRLEHPEVGELRIGYEVLSLPDDQQQLITWLPADQAAGTPLRTVIGGVVGGALPVSPARLRVVGNE